MQTMTHRFTPELKKIERDSHDKCSSCGKPFQYLDTAHSGYSKKGQPLFVGACCESEVAETAARYAWQARSYEIPRPETILWRYMDFAKFVALLKDRAIYFSRADLLGDPWEGAKGALTNKDTWDAHYLSSFRDAYHNPPPGVEFNLSEEQIDREAHRLLDEMRAGSERDLRSRYVSCWHENESESEALWRLYCPPPSAGIAIRTTLRRLNQSLGDTPSIAIGRVQYVDFRKGFADLNGAMFRKRRSLSHEKEVRAVLFHHPNREVPGHSCPIDPNMMLDGVVVSPFAPMWFESVLKETMSRFGVNAPIESSELMLEPFF